jgi:hypothetical protein
MAVTKITVSTAMRARDVSRPQAEHLAEAAERREAATRQPEDHPDVPAPAQSPAQEPPPAVRLPGIADQGQASPRRRRRRGR